MLARGRPVVQIKDQKLYSDLLELSRCVLCAMLTFTCQMERNRAFCLIMGHIGGMRYENLAQAFVSWPLPMCYDLLKDILLCFQFRDSIFRGLDRKSTATRYYAAGLSAYKTEIPFTVYVQCDIHPSSFCVPFLSFLGLVLSLNTSPALPRLAIELGIPEFVTKNCPLILESHRKEVISAQVVIGALIQGLEPLNDAAAVAQLDVLMDIERAKAVNPTLLHQPFNSVSEFHATKIDFLAFIKSYILTLKLIPIANNIKPGTTILHAKEVKNLASSISKLQPIFPDEINHPLQEEKVKNEVGLVAITCRFVPYDQ
ncbi:hypothetical protein BDP27DRAFT_575374 [Rhodocollybia butyracea]|uniref:Uncharacterized protein n=1 Tax=Rhodocollybia butyracea TaxID=206335 RepID=A0A9P5P8H6_9AGAR|nr:hypothetical protein BDP27DRAFT_575374 [Rhodocollybia butyracea]